ncbi:type I-C CRISPR-associated endonuclease Cas1 [Acetobacterium paludosum]|uniref:CRISPR-associated endonuclease Cas1 n=1 Tax=Acetobacterium paludosum TaxID=52693 RepID=A0A923HT64_9FIRM|nr:type I-C CRISPR-associated endonuclease Cas1c [Acetobacterium paludosum]MBC3888188.1 type I-C CRISPR-associated endonuclease Cas1 [Acetobacterium paludosum]
MKKLLNSLYITTPNSYLSLDGENLVVLLEDNEKFRLPFVNIENIICFGYMGASPALMGKCADNNISINFLKPNGEYLARIVGKTKGNVLLRKKQYTLSENEEFCLNISKNIIAAKLCNSRMTLERTIRDNFDKIDTSNLKITSNYIANNIDRIYEFNDSDQLRGFEGIIARNYFSVFSDMVLAQKKDFSMIERSKRPPLDFLNCMLSYLYTILSFEVRSALETVGLDPYVGFMHTLRPGRPSLALDLMEELRAYMVDRVVLTMINLKHITKKDFQKKEGGGVLMTDDGRKKILKCWQDRKKEIIMHPYIKEKIEIGLIPYVQAQLLGKYLREELPEYCPFLMR